jgi:hypothetical protein
LAALALGVWLVWPAQALAQALVRFIHGVPGVGKATVDIDGRPMGAIGFAQSTTWRSIRSGSFQWSLTAGGHTLAGGTSTVGSGAYDIVILEKSMKVGLGIYKAQGGRGATSLIRVIHAAPELGSPELTIDGKQAVKSLGYTSATPYVPLSPGAHSLGAMRPGSSTPLVPGGHVQLLPGVSYSAVVLGTRGQMVRLVSLVDRGVPLTRKSAPAPAAPAAAAPAASDAAAVVVRPGDSLWGIARALMGPSASDSAVASKVHALWDMNARRIGTGDPNLIFPGTRLRTR